jgi:hypothetical protein
MIMSILWMEPRSLQPTTSTNFPAISKDFVKKSGSGLEPNEAGSVQIQWYDYGPNGVTFEESNDLEKLCSTERPEGQGVRWINVDGLRSTTFGS